MKTKLIESAIKIILTYTPQNLNLIGLVAGKHNNKNMSELRS